MHHLKECPWDDEKWRPARLELATSSPQHRADVMMSRNYAQHQQANAKLIQPMGMEKTVRQAVKKGKWPKQKEAINASYMPGGFHDYEQYGNNCGTMNASLKRELCTNGRNNDDANGKAASYGLLPAQSARLDTSRSVLDSARSATSKASWSSSTSPLFRAGCPPTMTIMPRSGSAPAMGASYKLRPQGIGTTTSTFSKTLQSIGGVQGIVGSGGAAGSRDFQGFGGGGRGTGSFIGF